MNRDILANLEKSRLVEKIIKQLDIVPPSYEWGLTWESIIFPEGYEKPPKEEFEAKLQELVAAQPLKELRTKRNTVLEQSDRYAINDYPHSNLAVQQEWLDYRQALRDLPSVTEDPANPVWPVRPDEVVAVVVEEESSNVVVKEESSNVVVEEETSNVVVE